MKPADVTEADRKAMVAFHKAQADRLMHDIKYRTNLLEPKGDDTDPLIQAFAAHRIAAYEAGRVAGLEEAMEACDPDWFNQEGESIREAIRALKEKNDG